jgi:hypothetical protein
MSSIAIEFMSTAAKGDERNRHYAMALFDNGELCRGHFVERKSNLLTSAQFC